MARERLLPSEKEKKRQLTLALFSHNLSNAILTGDGKHPLGDGIPDRYLVSFQKGSLADRRAHWQKESPKANFGEQMLMWLGEDHSKPNMSDWLGKQTDPDVVGILTQVGLKGAQESLAARLQDTKVKGLIQGINTDLEKVGKDTLGDLTSPDKENQARSLIFYSRYLNPSDTKGEGAKSLIDTLVAYAVKESNGNADGAIALLQKVAPLFLVAGQEGQHALGALMVAKTHLVSSKDTVQSADRMQLKDDEKYVLGFLQKNREYEEPKPLEPGVPHNTEDILKNLEPNPEEGHAYWVDKEIPVNLVQNLTRDQLKSLEMRKTFFVLDKQTKRLSINRDVFDPAYVLGDDMRFMNATVFTDGISGFISLASASAETPEKQIALYKTLGEIVLRVHGANPELLDGFLRAQTPESREQFVIMDENRALPISEKKNTALTKAASEAFQQRFGKPYKLDNDFSPEEEMFLHEQAEAVMAQMTEFNAVLLKNFTEYPDRLLSLRIVPTTEGNLLAQFETHLNIPETVDGWKKRIVPLQEVLHQDPLTLTVEQMRQIEFLGRSVDVKKVMTWLHNGTPPLPQEEPQSAPTELLQKPDGSTNEANKEAPETLETVFINLGNAKDNTLGDSVQPREEIV